MGAWNTLHLFDIEKFEKEIVPTLRGEKGCFKNDYKAFLSTYRLGGISNIDAEELEKIIDKSVTEVTTIANQFDASFKRHKIYNAIEDWHEQRVYLERNEFYYEFSKFFEYYVFLHCVDFYPHLYTGKRGVLSVFDPKPRSIGEEILCNLDFSETFFCADGMGIVNWINTEDIKILLKCKEDLFSKATYTDEDYQYMETFIQLFEIAADHNYGLIRGVDLRERILERFPQYKLIDKEVWVKFDFDGNYNNHFTCVTEPEATEEICKKEDEKPPVQKNNKRKLELLNELEATIGIQHIIVEEDFNNLIKLDKAIVYLKVNWSGYEMISRGIVYTSLDEIQDFNVPVFLIDCSEQNKLYVEEWLTNQRENRRGFYYGGYGETLLIHKGILVDFIKHPSKLKIEAFKEKIKEWEAIPVDHSFDFHQLEKEHELKKQEEEREKEEKEREAKRYKKVNIERPLTYKNEFLKVLNYYENGFLTKKELMSQILDLNLKFYEKKELNYLKIKRVRKENKCKKYFNILVNYFTRDN